MESTTLKEVRKQKIGLNQERSELERAILLADHNQKKMNMNMRFDSLLRETETSIGRRRTQHLNALEAHFQGELLGLKKRYQDEKAKIYSVAAGVVADLLKRKADEQTGLAQAVKSGTLDDVTPSYLASSSPPLPAPKPSSNVVSASPARQDLNSSWANSKDLIPPVLRGGVLRPSLPTLDETEEVEEERQEQVSEKDEVVPSSANPIRVSEADQPGCQASSRLPEPGAASPIRKKGAHMPSPATSGIHGQFSAGGPNTPSLLHEVKIGA